MILTGPEIHRQRSQGRIVIEPFEPSLVKIDSYNYRLGRTLKIWDGGTDADGRPTFDEREIPSEGLVLPAGQMTLGHTFETIGSDTFAMSLIGRSSVGRLGLFLQVSADLGHTTSEHEWTLELVPALPFRVYPLMRVGQVTFWANDGEPPTYEGAHGLHNGPTQSLLDACGIDGEERDG